MLRRFEEEKIPFEIAKGNCVTREISEVEKILGGLAGTDVTIEIFVHPAHEAKAIEILGEET
jgi:hypothetical protein